MVSFYGLMVSLSWLAGLSQWLLPWLGWLVSLVCAFGFVGLCLWLGWLVLLAWLVCLFGFVCLCVWLVGGSQFCGFDVHGSYVLNLLQDANQFVSVSSMQRVTDPACLMHVQSLFAL